MIAVGPSLTYYYRIPPSPNLMSSVVLVERVLVDIQHDGAGESGFYYHRLVEACDPLLAEVGAWTPENLDRVGLRTVMEDGDRLLIDVGPWNPLRTGSIGRSFGSGPGGICFGKGLFCCL